MPRPARLTLEPLEDRTTPTVFTPAQMRAAYGINAIPAFGGTVTANGAGQTIAIVDAYNAPDIQSDLATFDADYGLAAPPSFRVVNQSGGTTLPGTDPNRSDPWDLEESLDVEWAHAIAPGANIILVECNNAGTLDAGDTWAASSGASVVSNSWGGGEYGGETGDTTFTNPSATGSPGVAFLFSAGDSGVIEYPSASPNVLSVGGTSLYVNSNGTYNSETAWNGAGGGGTSAVESRPSYQNVTVGGIAVSSVVGSHRGTPDVSMDADPNTGVDVLDSFDNPNLVQVGGTSLSCPMWAGLVSIIDQGRAQVGLQPLNTSVESQSAPNLTSYQLQTDLYDLAANPTTYATDFHDITSGSNSAGSAKTGYDLVTGLGSPIANTLVPDMVGYTNTSLTINTGSPTAFGAISLTATVTGKTAPPTGTVDFKFGSIDLGTATISGGVATLNLTSSPLTVGSDGITAYYSGDANYAISNGSKTASVATATSGTSLSASLSTLTYGQSEMFTATVSGVSGHTPTGYVDFKVGGTDLGTMQLSGGVATLTTTALLVGSETVTAYYLGDSNYATSNNSKTVTVNPATLTITANNDSKTYGTVKNLSGTAFTESGLVTANGDTITGVTEMSSGSPASATVGGYSIVASGATGSGLSNYTINYVDGTLTVNAATLTITANNDSKTYGNVKNFSGTAFTESGLVTANGDTITSVTETSSGSPASATVGGYSIVASSAMGTGLGNYTINYVDGTLTVNAATLTITANNDSKTYGTVKNFSGTAFTESGLVTANGDTITSVSETSSGSPASATVGSYSIVVSGAMGSGLGNYTIDYVNGTLTVAAEVLTITADPGQGKTYSDPDPTLTYQITTGTLLNGDTLSGALTRTAGENVGSYAIGQGTLAVSNPSDYTLTFVGANFAIAPRQLTIAANPGQHKAEDTPDPTLTYQLIGGNLVNGDALTGSLGRTPGENPGTHAITLGTLSAGSNYNINFIGASFTIGGPTYRVVTGSATGGLISIYDNGNPVALNVSPYGAFKGGVAVAVGDVNGDGVPDIATVVASGGAAEVKVFNGATGAILLDFMAFPAFYTGGASIALADLDGTGRDDIIVGTSSEFSAVAVYDGTTGALHTVFQAYPEAPTTGVQVAAGQLDGSGRAQIVTVPTGFVPLVRVFDGDGTMVNSFLVGSGVVTGQLTVAVGDPSGSGTDQILIGANALGLDFALAYNTAGTMQDAAILPVTPSASTTMGPQLAVATFNGRTLLLFTEATYIGAFDGSTLNPIGALLLYPNTYGPLDVG